MNFTCVRHSCRLLLVLLALGGVFNLHGQNNPVYNGYFLNPFFYNPAAAATDRLQINGGYRKQWVGVDGAPTITSLTATTLLNDSRVGVGLKASSISRGFLKSTDVSLTYAYGIPLNLTNRLFFGISGGMLSNAIDLKDVSTISDPALANLSSSMAPAAAFGVLYKNASGLNLGVTFPRMIQQPSLNATNSISPADNLLVSASFSRWDPKATKKPVRKTKGRSKKKPTKNIPFEFFSVYRYSSTNGGLFEATGKLNLHSAIWLSASYRQNTGVVPGLGIVTDNVAISYFYEPGVAGDLPFKTHEIMLTLKLGAEKKFRGTKPPVIVKKTTPTPQPKKTEPVVAQKKVEEKKVVPPVEEKKVPAPVEEKKVPAPVEEKIIPPVVEEKKTPVVEEKKAEPPIEEKKEERLLPVGAPLDSTVQHRAKYGVRQDVLDTVALHPDHAEERAELNKHLDDHDDGAHDDPHDHPVNERHDFVKKGTHHEELEVGTFVISGAFKSRANAEHFSQTLKQLGFEADFGHLTARNLWYVFIANESNVDTAKAERNRLQKNKIFKDVWLLTVQE